MSVILIDKKIKCIEEENLYIFEEKELDELKALNLVSSQKRTYQFVINHKKYSLICPLRVENGKIIGVYLPAVKSPYRPYPCYVYIFAIILVLNTHSMRESAKLTSQKFGIPKFSHSTISRVFQKLLSELENLKTLKMFQAKLRNISSDAKPKFVLKALLQGVQNSNELMTDLVFQYFKKYQRLLI